MTQDALNQLVQERYREAVKSVGRRLRQRQSKECMMTRAPKYMCPQGHPVKRTCQELTIEPLHWFCKDCRSTYTDDGVTLKSKVITQRALIEQQAKELTELREWKHIILGTGTDQDAVIRMAAAEYTKVAIQTWKEANDKQAKEIARLKEDLTVAESALRSKGYRKDCDIPACNCGPQWNHGGLADMRLREISDLLPYANGLTIIQRIERLLEKEEHP